MSHRRARAGQGRQENGVTTKFRCLAAYGPAGSKPYAADLRQDRAQDKQVFAHRLGDFIVIGPEGYLPKLRWSSCWRMKPRASEGVEAELD
jgi:hypothetical protein